jgi:2-polyprenyl-3-methyl-5-hydroxy-6-metoxy-1,4-benzoquinol methylase
MKTEKVNCDLCGCDIHKELWNKVDRVKQGYMNSISIMENGIMYNGTNVQCQKCGLVYISDRITQKDMDKYYEEKYRNDYVPRPESELMHAKDAINYLGNNNIEPCKSLDIGCSGGVLVEQLQLNGFDAYGIDSSSVCSDLVKEIGLKIENVPLENYKEKDFGLITILNTLEHMHSPRKALEKIHSILKDDGKLMIVVPELYNCVLKVTVDGFLSNAHLYTFDTYTIMKYLELTGFEIENMCIVDEFNMQKVYAICRKTEPKEPDFYKKVNTQDLKQRLYATDFIVLKAKQFREER